MWRSLGDRGNGGLCGPAFSPKEQAQMTQAELRRKLRNIPTGLFGRA
jgi:hypothetical protein